MSPESTELRQSPRWEWWRVYVWGSCRILLGAGDCSKWMSWVDIVISGCLCCFSIELRHHVIGADWDDQPITLSSSFTLVSSALSNAWPYKIGASNNVMLSFGTCMKSLKIWNWLCLLSLSWWFPIWMYWVSDSFKTPTDCVDSNWFQLIPTDDCVNILRQSGKIDWHWYIIYEAMPDFSSFRISCMDSQNSNELKGSPCCGPSLDGIMWFP